MSNPLANRWIKHNRNPNLLLINESRKPTRVKLFFTSSLSRKTFIFAAFIQRGAIRQEDADLGAGQEGEPVAAFGALAGTQTVVPENNMADLKKQQFGKVLVRKVLNVLLTLDLS